MNPHSPQAGTTLTSFCDESLVEAAKNGQHAAYVELSKRHTQMIFRVVSRITKNREDAEDALQESLMKAFSHLHTFDGRSSFSTWITRIAINSALMVLRKKRIHPESSLDSDLDSAAWRGEQNIHPSPGPEKLYIQQEREHNLRKAIHRLPSTLREVIEIRHARDASVKEVAAIMGISIPATKSRLLRARNILIESMDRQRTSVPYSRGAQQSSGTASHLEQVAKRA